MSQLSETKALSLTELLREKIIAGSLEAGMPLRQESIAREYSISRIPVREALLNLESEGLVENSPHRGFRVQAMNRADVEDIFNLRLLIEPGLVADVSSASKPGHYDESARLLAGMEHELSSRGPGVEYARLHQSFHRSLYNSNERHRTVEVLDRLYILSERYIRFHLSAHSGRSGNEHRELLDACQASDRRRITSTLKSHISNTLSDLLTEIES